MTVETKSGKNKTISKNLNAATTADITKYVYITDKLRLINVSGVHDPSTHKMEIKTSSTGGSLLNPHSLDLAPEFIYERNSSEFNNSEKEIPFTIQLIEPQIYTEIEEIYTKASGDPVGKFNVIKTTETKVL